MILDTIIEHKLKELKNQQSQVSLSTLKSKVPSLEPTKDFLSAIAQPDSINLIAEVKKKSPSKGIIREDFDPVMIAKTYAEYGASAVSVLTDEHFFCWKSQLSIRYPRNRKPAITAKRFHD